MLDRLRPLVLKRGVSLGGLPDAERLLALAVPALRLAPGAGLDEAGVNRLLKAALAEEAAFLDTDHVELRRWLVDTGWWQRDGYGRRYERTATAALPSALQVLAQALEAVDLVDWVAAEREAVAVERQRRRDAWRRQQGADGIGED